MHLRCLFLLPETQLLHRFNPNQTPCISLFWIDKIGTPFNKKVNPEL